MVTPTLKTYLMFKYLVSMPLTKYPQEEDKNQNGWPRVKVKCWGEIQKYTGTINVEETSTDTC